MPAITQTVKGHQELVVTVPPSDRPRQIHVSAWKDRRRNIQVNIAHDGVDVSRPIDIEPRRARRGESEFDALDETRPIK